MKPNTSVSVAEAQAKLEYYCSYQDRCHDEVETKLQNLGMIPEAREKIIIYLIENNFLNETRFACSFARGKHRIKHWGKIRIVNELKFRHISKYNMDLALKEFSEDEYLNTFHSLAERQWENIREKNVIKKRKKFCDFMLRKGFESNLVYEKVKLLEG